MNVEKWINELQIAVADLARKIRDAAASAFAPDITTPSDGQIIVYDGTGSKWKNADLPASGVKITTGTTIGGFPETPAEGDIHYLLDPNGYENAKYRYNGEAWDQLSGFNYDLANTSGIKVTNGYGLFQKLGSSALADFTYNLSEMAYQLGTGGGTFKKFFYITDPVIVDPAVISGFTITGKFRNAALNETVDWTESISNPYCGLLMIGYGTDNEGNWLFWQLCRPFLLETDNNALPQGLIVAKQSGGSGNFFISSLTLNKVQTTNSKRRKTK